MTKIELKKIIRRIIKEEIGILLPVAVNTLMEDVVMKGVRDAISEISITKKHKNIIEEIEIEDEPIIPKKSIQSNRTKRQVSFEGGLSAGIKEILPEQKPISVPRIIQFQSEDNKTETIDVSKVPETILENIFTRNYSDFMKKSKNFKR